MGFILKTTFWLGLVFYAMPLGEAPPLTLPVASGADASLCALASVALAAKLGPTAEVYRDAATAGCASLLAGKAGALHAGAGTPPHEVSRQSLTERDRQPPWLGPPARPRTS